MKKQVQEAPYKPSNESISVLTVTPKMVSHFFLGIVMLLLLADLSIIYLKFGLGHHYLRGLIEGFYFDAEGNFPSLYSALAIFFCAFLLWKISLLESESKKGNRVYWRFLTFSFLFLGVDEFISIHEYLIEPMQGLVSRLTLRSEFLYFAWFIPYTTGAVVCGVFLLRFFFRLPAQSMKYFFIAGITFFAGAVGMEMVGGYYWVSQGWSIEEANNVNVQYALITTLEEVLEMLGIVIFIRALADYYFQRYSISFLVNTKPAREGM